RARAPLSTLSLHDALPIFHALCLEADTPQKAAAWTGLSQIVADRELHAMVDLGLVERHESARGVTYAPSDGHLVVQIHVALAHRSEEHTSELQSLRQLVCR